MLRPLGAQQAAVEYRRPAGVDLLAGRENALQALTAVLRQMLVVQGDALFDTSVNFYPAVTQQHDARTGGLDGADRVADHHDRGAALLQGLDPFHTFELIGEVAHGEHLVQQQDVGICVYRHGEAEPHQHSRRVELDRGVDELPQLGEVDDLLQPCRDLALVETQEHAV